MSGKIQLFLFKNNVQMGKKKKSMKASACKPLIKAFSTVNNNQVTCH